MTESPILPNFLEVDINSLQLIGSGTTADILAMPGKTQVIKVFRKLDIRGLEIFSDPNNNRLNTLLETLKRIGISLPEPVSIISIPKSTHYESSAILMPNLSGRFRQLQLTDLHKVIIQPLGTMVLSSDLNKEYLGLVARLHAHGIVISPHELNRGSHAENQALASIPAILDGNMLILLDWTNLTSIDFLPDHISRIDRIRSDLLNTIQGFGFLFQANSPTTAELYRQTYLNEFRNYKPDDANDIEGFLRDNYGR